MHVLKWPLFFLWLCFGASQTEASSWTINLPSSVEGLPGSCVVIPCSFNYPDPGKKVTKFTGIWNEETGHIYHPVESKILQQYRNRTKLQGDITQKNCSLKIDPLQENDQGPFYFRIEIAEFNNFSYKENRVSITINNGLNVAISMKGEVVEGQLVEAFCSVSPSCPTSPPVFSWSHSGEERFHSVHFDEDQWKAKASLTFRPTSADHNKPLQCTVRDKGGKEQETFKLLKVKHAPVNVKVEYKSDVREGEAVQLKCSNDAYPPASTYKWHYENGTQLHEGDLYTLTNVSRHMSALYCTAINTLGHGRSSPVKLSVLYAPEIKTISSCSSRDGVVKCMCIVESKPPCMVHFVLSNRVLPGTKIESHGFVTIGSLQADFGSFESVSCLANNTEGKASHILTVPVKSKMNHLYIAVTVGAGVGLVILSIAVGFVKKCRGTSGGTPTPHMSAMMTNKAEEHSQNSTTKSLQKEICYDDVKYPSSHANDHVYGNTENDWDDAIYANM